MEWAFRFGKIGEDRCGMLLCTPGRPANRGVGAAAYYRECLKWPADDSPDVSSFTVANCAEFAEDESTVPADLRFCLGEEVVKKEIAGGSALETSLLRPELESDVEQDRRKLTVDQTKLSE